MFNTGEKIYGHQMKQFMKDSIYFCTESGTKLYAHDIKDDSVYEFTGMQAITGEGEKHYVKLADGYC